MNSAATFVSCVFVPFHSQECLRSGRSARQSYRSWMSWLPVPLSVNPSLILHSLFSPLSKQGHVEIGGCLKYSAISCNIRAVMMSVNAGRNGVLLKSMTQHLFIWYVTPEAMRWRHSILAYCLLQEVHFWNRFCAILHIDKSNCK